MAESGMSLDRASPAITASGRAQRGFFGPGDGHRFGVVATISLVALVTMGLSLVVADAASASIVTSQASLVDGQLTIVGSGAVPHSTVTVDDGLPIGQADAKGDFSISASGFSEPSCVATLFDGSVSVEVTLSGCTADDRGDHRRSPPPHRRSGRCRAPRWWNRSRCRGSRRRRRPESSYRWQVSTDPSFATLVLTATTSPKVTTTTLSGLALGTYYWRVQSVRFPPDPYFPLFGEWTPQRSLTITGEAAGTPGSPTVLAPTAGSEYHPDETYPIQWTTATGAASYRLQLASNSTFAPGTLLVDVPESGTEAHAPLMQFQTPLFIRVFAVNAGGVLGLPSPTVAIQLTYKAPVPARAQPAGTGERGHGAAAGHPQVDPRPQPAGGGLPAGDQLDPELLGRLRGCGGVRHRAQPTARHPVLPAGGRPLLAGATAPTVWPGLTRGAVTAWSAARSFTVSNAPPQVESLTIDVFTEGGVVLRSHTHVFSGTNEDNEAFGIVQLTTPAPAGGDNHRPGQQQPEGGGSPAVDLGPRRAGTRELHDPAAAGRRPAPLTLSGTLGGHAVTAPLTVDPASLNQVFIESNEQARRQFPA